MSGLSQRLREIRKEYGLSQRAFAEFLGVTVTSYPNYEKYETHPTIEDMVQMGVILDLSLDYLNGLTDERRNLSDTYDMHHITPFRQRIKELRERAGLTQLAAAEAVGLRAKSEYVFYESGHRRPSFQRMVALTNVFGVTLDELVGFRPKG